MKIKYTCGHLSNRFNNSTKLKWDKDQKITAEMPTVLFSLFLSPLSAHMALPQGTAGH